VEGKHFKSCEQAYQYFKAVNANQPRLARDILASQNAADAKRLSKRIVGAVDRSHDVALMKKLLRLKLDQCPEFKKALSNSTNQRLVHSTTKNDLFWGSGLPHTQREFSWFPGKNTHGYLLTVLRDSLSPISTPESDSSVTLTVSHNVCNKESNFSVVRKHSLSNVRSNVYCFCCGEPGHVKRVCKYLSTGLKCNSCGRFGHKKKFCHLYRPINSYSVNNRQNVNANPVPLNRIVTCTPFPLLDRYNVNNNDAYFNQFSNQNF
jgi:predicted NAD-dependent protein-ADP-ribosyltransferase YbiA (DUF1768 family)